MSLTMPTQNLERIVEQEKTKPSSEIYASVAMVLAAFSKPPFGEEWTINGSVLPGFLRIPEVTQQLLQTLYKDQTEIPENFNDKWEESWTIDKSIVLKILGDYTNSTSLKSFVEQGWITSEELKTIQNTKEDLELDPSDKVIIGASYPPSKLLLSYKEQSEDSRSLVLLGGYSDGSSTFTTRRVTPNEVSNITIPRFMGRIRHIDPNKEDVIEGCKEELVYYLKGKELEDAIQTISPQTDAQTIFLGEIAKVEGVSDIDGVTLSLAMQYFSEVVGGKQENIPDQCMYFTLADTKVAKHGLATLANLAIRQTIKTSYKYVEEKILIDWEGTKLILGKLKLIKA